MVWRKAGADGKTEPLGAVRDHVRSTGRLITRNAKSGAQRRIFYDYDLAVRLTAVVFTLSVVDPTSYWGLMLSHL